MNFKQLLEDYRKGKLDAEQRSVFERLLHEMESEGQSHQLMDASFGDIPPVDAEETQAYIYERIKQQYLREVAQGSEAAPISRVHLLHRWGWAAAVLILVLGAGTYFFLQKTPAPPVARVQPVNDATPGTNKAILTLADGSKVTLDSAGNQIIQLGTTAIQQQGGQLQYSAQGGETSVSYNTLTTPRGGQFQVKLPDGTKVWLNAASTLRYPTAFTGKERKVEINGEAYFEIAKNAAMPFIVDILSGQGEKEGTVQVIGTHFNINAYSDEATIKTTLLEGAVRILKNGSISMLFPGQQAVIDGESLHVIKESNTDEAVAWKNGIFNFEENDIQSVMRQIARWYDVDIKYENISTAHFMGTISRNVNMSEVLNMIALTGAVHFKVEGRTITVKR